MFQKISESSIPDVKFTFPTIAEDYGALRPRPEKLWPFFEENDHFSPQVQRTSSLLISLRTKSSRIPKWGLSKKVWASQM